MNQNAISSMHTFSLKLDWEWLKWFYIEALITLVSGDFHCIPESHSNSGPGGERKAIWHAMLSLQPFRLPRIEKTPLFYHYKMTMSTLGGLPDFFKAYDPKNVYSNHISGMFPNWPAAEIEISFYLYSMFLKIEIASAFKSSLPLANAALYITIKNHFKSFFTDILFICLWSGFNRITKRVNSKWCHYR